MNLSYYRVSALEDKDHDGIEEYIVSRKNKINGFAEIRQEHFNSQKSIGPTNCIKSST